MAELQGTGRDPPKLKLSRTHVSLHEKGRLTVIPLDQIDHVRGGRQRTPAFIAAGVALILLGLLIYAAAWYLYDPVPVLALAAPAGGLLLGAAAIALYFTQTAQRVRVASGEAEALIDLPASAGDEAAAFVRAVLAARTQYLEGVYEEGA